MSSKVSVITPKRAGREPFIQYRIWGTYDDGTPYEVKRKSHLSSISATERWADKREREMHDEWKEKRQQEHQSPTLGELWADFLLWSRSRRNEEGTIDWKTNLYTTRIAKTIGESTRVDKIDGDTITRFKLALGDLKPKSANNVLGLLKSLLLFAQRKRKLAYLPEIEMLGVPEAPPKFLRFDEYEKLLAGARELADEGKWQPLAACLLGGDSGLRRGEIIALHWADIDLDECKIFVRWSWTKRGLKATKSNRYRVAAISEETARVLKAHRHLRGPLVFYQPKGRPPPPASPKTLYNWFELACERAKINPRGRIHVLRHTFGSHLAEAGVSPFRIQTDLGHSDLKTTEIYTKIAAQNAKESQATLQAYRKSKRKDA